MMHSEIAATFLSTAYDFGFGLLGVGGKAAKL